MKKSQAAAAKVCGNVKTTFDDFVIVDKEVLISIIDFGPLVDLNYLFIFQNSNVLSAILSLIRDLDGPSLEVVEMAVTKGQEKEMVKELLEERVQTVM